MLTRLRQPMAGRDASHRSTQRSTAVVHRFPVVVAKCTRGPGTPRAQSGYTRVPNNPRYVFIYPFIDITAVDIGPLRPQLNESIDDFGVRGASWGELAPPGKVFKLK